MYYINSSGNYCKGTYIYVSKNKIFTKIEIVVACERMQEVYGTHFSITKNLHCAPIEKKLIIAMGYGPQPKGIFRWGGGGVQPVQGVYPLKFSDIF